jgi:deoxyribonuclease-4
MAFRFGTVGSPISTPKKPGGSVGAVQHIKAMGLGALELGWVQSVRVSEETCAAIRQQVKETGVLLSIHAPYYINLNADFDEWPNARRRLMAAAHYGNLAGATEIIFHPGSYSGKQPAEAMKLAIARLQDCVAELRREKNPVTLRPETMGRTGQLGTLEETLEMAKTIPGVVPCIDFAHLHARTGNGAMNSYDEWIAALKLYAKMLGKPALKNLSCHLSGIAYTERGEKNHLTMAESDFKLEELLRALLEMGCAGRILSESPILEQDALLYQETWQRLGGEVAK